MNNFIVFERSDRDKLQSILDKYKANNSILTSGNLSQNIDLRGHEPDEQFQTPLRILDVCKSVFLDFVEFCEVGADYIYGTGAHGADCRPQGSTRGDAFVSEERRECIHDPSGPGQDKRQGRD